MIPKYTVKTNHQSNTGQNFSLQFNTTVPCIHLDNIKQIANVRCSANLIHVTFRSSHDAEEALRVWSIEELTVLMGFERGCNGRQVSTFKIHTIFVKGLIMTMHINQILDRSEIIVDWSFSLRHLDSGKVKHLERRGIWRSIQKSLNYRYDRNSTKAYELSFNIDPINKTIIAPQVPIYDFNEGTASCIDCYTTGGFQILFEAAGVGPFVNSYNIGIQGHINSSMNMEITSKNRWSKSPEPIFVLPFPGGSFRLKIGVSVSARTEMKATFGMELQIPIDIRAHSHKKDILVAPIFTTKESPIINIKPIQNASVGSNTAIALSIEPDISLEAGSIFNTITGYNYKREDGTSGLMSIGVNFKNSVGVDLIYKPSGECIAKALQAQFVHDRAVILHWTFLGVVSKKWYLWRLKNVVYCWSCDKCGGGVRAQIE